MRMDNSSDDYLVLCSYAIALLDLISAVLFAAVSAMLYIQHRHFTSLTGLLFSIIWICVIFVLLAGVYFRKLSFVRYWLVFTCLGIMLDSILLLYGLTLAVSISWNGAKITLLPFMGLAVEMTFVYIIYVFYINMITDDLWIPVAACRMASGCATNNHWETPASDEHRSAERKRLRRLYKREERMAMRELQRKLRRGQA